ncbi:MAG: SRPBCC domain-containing protein [Alphaproteobacteria bacterium]|nr:SRPBCC domain-containing protein [Alphaproteobacteria bacterium]
MTDLDEGEDTVALQIAVPLAPAAAWDLFVTRFGDWWPSEYTFCGEALADIGIDAQADGPCYERAQSGERIVWGTVIEAAAPRGLMFLWHIAPDRKIDTEPERSSTVTVHFAPTDHGTTVTVMHSDLSHHGDGWEQYRAAMASEQGWPYCLDHFRAAAGG